MRLVASDSCKRNVGREPGDPFSFEDLVATILPEDRDRKQAAIPASIESRATTTSSTASAPRRGRYAGCRSGASRSYDADGRR